MTGRPPLMIFAAGFGTRMGPLTRDLPKPMLPVAGRRLIDHSLDIAKSAGIETIFANTHYLHDRISPHLESSGVTVLHETPDILETGGGLKAAGLPSPALTLNPDAIFLGPNPLTALLDAWHDDMQALLLVVPARRAVAHAGTGDFDFEGGRLRRGTSCVYTGVQMIRTDRLAEIPDRAFSLNRYWDLISRDGGLHGLVYEGDWVDVGSPAGLAAAEARLSDADV